jgi:hypothetical protein
LKTISHNIHYILAGQFTEKEIDLTKRYPYTLTIEDMLTLQNIPLIQTTFDEHLYLLEQASKGTRLSRSQVNLLWKKRNRDKIHKNF